MTTSRGTSDLKPYRKIKYALSSNFRKEDPDGDDDDENVARADWYHSSFEQGLDDVKQTKIRMNPQRQKQMKSII